MQGFINDSPNIGIGVLIPAPTCNLIGVRVNSTPILPLNTHPDSDNSIPSITRARRLSSPLTYSSS